jgi:hypothetical protein
MPSIQGTISHSVTIGVGRTDMTRQELDAAIARLGLDVPEKERDGIAAAAVVVEDMVARLRPAGGRAVARNRHMLCISGRIEAWFRTS